MIQNIQNVLAVIGMPGGFELIVILIIALLIFGKRLPSIANSIGRSMTEFKKGINTAKETKDQLKNDAVNMAKDAVGLNDLENDNN